MLKQYLSQNGKVQPDPSMGRFLAELISKVPQIEQDEFEGMLNANMKVKIFFSCDHKTLVSLQ